MTIADRVVGCLQRIATGDAIGKQTEALSHDEVRRYYLQLIRGFEGIPGSIIPRYVGNRKHEWRMGETTDDTERTIAVARAILSDNGAVSHTSVGREMLGCTKCVHPGVKSLWEFHQANNPARIAREHDGCGAAIRVAPVGIVFRTDRLEEIVTGAREASISTHGGAVAIAAAAATAAAVSSAIDGAGPSDIIGRAEQAAAEAERRWPGQSSREFVRALRQVYDGLNAHSDLRAGELAERYFPDRPMTIVPLALALATTVRSAEQAILLAANIGGDSDSVASIAGGILGAAFPGTINQEWVCIVERINGHELAGAATALARLRH